MLSHLIRDHKAEVSELGVNPNGGKSQNDWHTHQFVGCCLVMLPLLWMEFASPPHFVPAWNDWGKTYSAQQFPMFDDVPQFLCLKLMCLASMVKHHWFIVECFNANHIVLASGQLF